MTGAQLIVKERERQISGEKYTLEHDDAHDDRSLASAALSYIEHYVGRAWVFTNELDMPGITDTQKVYREESPPDAWPWHDSWWKPKDPMHDLIKAGALIAAEIDRLQRPKS